MVAIVVVSDVHLAERSKDEKVETDDRESPIF